VSIWILNIEDPSDLGIQVLFVLRFS